MAPTRSMHQKVLRDVFTMFLLLGFFCIAKAGDDAWSRVRQVPQGVNSAWERLPAEGFAWPTSVRPGEQIMFYVSIRDTSVPPLPRGHTYRIQIFKLPDLTTVRWDSTNIVGTFYPLRDVNNNPIYPGDMSRKPVDFKKGCRDYWAPTAISHTIPSTESSGLYLARLNHLSLPDGDSLKYYYIPFVVRSLNPGTTTKVLFKFDFNTWQAYNYWGGGSLYSYPQDSSSLTPTDTIAMDRPIAWSIVKPITWSFTDFLNTINSLGHTMDYCNNIDCSGSDPAMPLGAGF